MWYFPVPIFKILSGWSHVDVSNMGAPVFVFVFVFALCIYLFPGIEFSVVPLWLVPCGCV